MIKGYKAYVKAHTFCVIVLSLLFRASTMELNKRKKVIWVK